MNVCFVTETKFLISDNLSNIYLSVYNYNNLILFGFDTFHKFTFLSNIHNLEEIGFIFYQLNEYSPLLYNEYNIFIISSNLEFQNKVIQQIKLYNKYWNLKLIMILKQLNNYIDTNILFVINPINQQISYLRKNYMNINNKKYFFNTNSIIN